MTSTERFLSDIDRFTSVVDATDDWSAQSPCEEWSARDVVDHVIDTHRSFLEKQGRPPAALPEGDGAAAWHAHVDQLREALADREFAGREFDGFQGPTTVEDQLADFYGFDLLAHRWDLGTATGQDVVFSDAELDTIETNVAALGDMFYSSGASKPALEVPDDASRQTRALASMGRAG